MVIRSVLLKAKPHLTADADGAHASLPGLAPSPIRAVAQSLSEAFATTSKPALLAPALFQPGQSAAQRIEAQLAAEIQLRARLSPIEIKARNQFQADQHFGTVGQSNPYVHLLRAAGHDYVGAVQGLLEDVGTVMGHDNFASAMRQDRLGNEAAAEHRRQRALDQGHMVQWEQVTSTQTPYSFVSAPRPQDGLALKAATHFIEYGMRLGQYAESLIVQSAVDLGVVFAGGIGGRALAGAAGVKSAAGLTVSGIAGASVLSVPANSGRVLAEQRQQSMAHSGVEKTHLPSALAIGAANSVINSTFGVDRMFVTLRTWGGVGPVLGMQPSKVLSVAVGESVVEMITGSTERLGAKVVEPKLQYFGNDYYSNLWAQGRDGFLAGLAVRSSAQVGGNALEATSALKTFLTRPTERVAASVEAKPDVFREQGHSNLLLDGHTQVGWQGLNLWGPVRVYGMPEPFDDGLLPKRSSGEEESTTDTMRPTAGSLAEMLQAASQDQTPKKNASDLAAAAKEKKEYQDKLNGLQPYHLDHFYNYLRLKAKQKDVFIFDKNAHDVAIEGLAKKFGLNSDHMHVELTRALGMELHDLIHHVGQLTQRTQEAQQQLKRSLVDLLAHGQLDGLELAADFMRHRTTGALEQTVDAQTLDKLQALAKALSNEPQSVPTDAAGLHHHLRWLFGTLGTHSSPQTVLDAIVAHPAHWAARTGYLPYFDSARVNKLLNPQEQKALHKFLSDASLTQVGRSAREGLANKLGYDSWDHLRLAHDATQGVERLQVQSDKKNSRVLAEAPKSKNSKRDLPEIDEPHPQPAATPETPQDKRTRLLGKRHGAMAVPDLSDEQIGDVVQQLEQGQSLSAISAQQPALLQLMAYQNIVLKTLELDIQNAQLRPALQNHLQYELRRARFGARKIEPQQVLSSRTVVAYQKFLRKSLPLHTDFFRVLNMLARDAKMRRLLLHPQLSPAVLQRLQALDNALETLLQLSQRHGATMVPNLSDAQINQVVLQLEQGQSLSEISAQQPALLQLVAYQDVVLKTLALDLNDVQLKLAFQKHLQYELHRALFGANAMESKRVHGSATVRRYRNYLRQHLPLHADFFLVLRMLATDAKMRRLLLHPQLSPAVLQRLQALDNELETLLQLSQRHGATMVPSLSDE